MIVNLSHPLSKAQRRALRDLVGEAAEPVRELPLHLDHARPLAPQVRAAVDGAGLSGRDWQTEPVLLVPPGFAPAACAVLAELHGRCGYFPPVVRLRPVPGSVPPAFEVAEAVDLAAVRDLARAGRGSTAGPGSGDG
ncbi:CRISPR-associated protein Csx15 [Alienimonas californiensis]|uniref:Uncharacterized protein n=1 Tax=Alienimonas californiensis TaxID=2527989 RepID=A0A517P6P5_9PLAN|nr:CRISPR-associated protein Csx15 [Alienimonas californiensis]QDT15045.1 hypothetical protein CA12_11250 [Alienimonas californiensis]